MDVLLFLGGLVISVFIFILGLGLLITVLEMIWAFISSAIYSLISCAPLVLSLFAGQALWKNGQDNIGVIIWIVGITAQYFWWKSKTISGIIKFIEEISINLPITGNAKNGNEEKENILYGFAFLLGRISIFLLWFASWR